MSNDSLVARCKGTDCNVRVSFWQNVQIVDTKNSIISLINF